MEKIVKKEKIKDENPELFYHCSFPGSYLAPHPGPHIEIQLSSSLVKMESWTSLFLSSLNVMLKTLQEQHRKAGRTTGS